MRDFDQDDTNDALREEMGNTVGFFLKRSGPILGIELASNGYIIRVRKVKECRVPAMDPAADPMLPPKSVFEHAHYEEKIVCMTLNDVLAMVRELLEEARSEELRGCQHVRAPL